MSLGRVLLQINERYLPQLSTVLSFPQSVGIVGGRPSASLYFVGVQGGAVLYLDPHEVQEVKSQHPFTLSGASCVIICHCLPPPPLAAVCWARCTHRHVSALTKQGQLGRRQ